MNAEQRKRLRVLLDGMPEYRTAEDPTDEVELALLVLDRMRDDRLMRKCVSDGFPFPRVVYR